MPEFQYWFSGTALFQFGAFVFAGVVGLVGIKTIISTKWFRRLVVIALALSFSAWWVAARQEQGTTKQEEQIGQLTDVIHGVASKLDVSAEELTSLSKSGAIEVDKIVAAITGGDSFCFFWVVPDDLKNPSGPFQLWIEATGTIYDVNYWISPASANRNARDPAYWSFDKGRPLIVVIQKGARMSGRELPFGDYFIEFDGRNGHWYERLTLSQVDGKAVEHYQVMDDGGKVLREAKYP